MQGSAERANRGRPYWGILSANSVAAAGHLGLFLWVLIAGMNSDRDFTYALKKDMLQMSTRNGAGTIQGPAINVSPPRAGRMQTPVENIVHGGASETATAPLATGTGTQASPEKANDASSGWMQGITDSMLGIIKSARTNSRRAQGEGDICQGADPNIFRFGRGDGSLVFEVSSYAHPTGVRVNLWHLVFSFFLLSSACQAAAAFIPTYNGNTIYTNMFASGESRLNINWLRYIEYSFSATVMLVAISVVAGINDLHLLVCMGAMCAACMLLGLCSEWIFRVRDYLKDSGVEFDKREDRDQILWICLYCAMLTHALAWALIAVPWYVIWQSYEQWWLAQDCSAGEAREERAPPPEFVRIIIVAQLVLFISFGAVQVVQFCLLQFKVPYATHATEWAYIVLSLTAKAILGIFVTQNVFM